MLNLSTNLRSLMSSKQTEWIRLNKFSLQIALIFIAWYFISSASSIVNKITLQVIFFFSSKVFSISIQLFEIFFHYHRNFKIYLLIFKC